MYPNLYYLFKDAFEWNLPALKIVNTFGFCVAISFLVCAWLLVKELKRKQAAGYFTYKETTIEVGKPASIVELLINFFFGFFLGRRCNHCDHTGQRRHREYDSATHRTEIES